MSTCYHMVCDQCKQVELLCTFSVSGDKFGISYNDEEGRKFALEFILEHTGHGIRIICDEPEGGEWRYLWEERYDERQRQEQEELRGMKPHAAFPEDDE